MDTLVTVITFALAIYGVATVISDYDGPFGLFSELRANFHVFRCAVCLSFWVMLGIMLLYSVHLAALAAFGLAILLIRNEL